MQTFLQAAKGKKNTLIKSLSIFLKITVFIAAAYYAYENIFIKHNISDLVRQYENLLSLVPILILCVVVLLSFANWGLEAIKWKYSLKNFETISFTKSLEAVLSGVTVSLASPNRTGEFAGRIFHLEKLNKIKASIITIIGSFSQLLITIMAGVTGAIILNSKNLFLSEEWMSYLPLALAIVFSLLLIYFNMRLGSNLFKRIFNKYNNYTEVPGHYTFKELLNILNFSFIRYLVFSIQFYLLLYISGVEVSLITGLSLISVIYVIITFIPTTILSEIAVRGSVSVAVISIISNDYLAIVNATFILWLVNLFFPAILGSVFLFKARIFKTPAIAE